MVASAPLRLTVPAVTVRIPGAELPVVRRAGTVKQQTSEGTVIEIKRIAPSDWKMLRDVRLRALQDSPDAFGSSYEREAGRPHEAWRLWAGRASDGNRDAMFVAADADAEVGVAGAYTPEGHENERHIISMWVAPEYRGRGIGRHLLDAVVQWAWGSGAQRVTLWVVDGNDGAAELYLKYGFRATGMQQRLPSNPDLIEILMEFTRDD